MAGLARNARSKRVGQGLLRALAATLLVGLLAACGTSLDAPVGEGDELVETASGVEISETLNELLELVNDVRSEGRQCGTESYDPVAPVTVDATLLLVAELHSNDQFQAKEMSHRGSDGSWPSERVRAAGYGWRTVGENVAWGYATAEQVLEGWLESPGHCGTIMNGDFTEVGLAVEGSYWTQVFAAPM
ncbi:MAG: CAP domain-containing protein [Trueperaceae bacterium]|nr:CAP domain-containing protein [Trueperaceae bacterium]